MPFLSWLPGQWWGRPSRVAARGAGNERRRSEAGARKERGGFSVVSRVGRGFGLAARPSLSGRPRQFCFASALALRRV